MPRITLATVVKLVLASILVGAAMAYFDVQPQDVWRWLGQRLGAILADFRHYATRALTYLLLGAVVVVPVWLVFYLWRALKGKS